MTEPDQSTGDTNVEVHAEDVEIDTGAQATTEGAEGDAAAEGGDGE